MFAPTDQGALESNRLPQYGLKPNTVVVRTFRCPIHYLAGQTAVSTNQHPLLGCQPTRAAHFSIPLPFHVPCRCLLPTLPKPALRIQSHVHDQDHAAIDTPFRPCPPSLAVCVTRAHQSCLLPFRLDFDLLLSRHHVFRCLIFSFDSTVPRLPLPTTSFVQPLAPPFSYHRQSNYSPGLGWTR